MRSPSRDHTLCRSEVGSERVRPGHPHCHAFIEYRRSCCPKLLRVTVPFVGPVSSSSIQFLAMNVAQVREHKLRMKNMPCTLMSMVTGNINLHVTESNSECPPQQQQQLLPLPQHQHATQSSTKPQAQVLRVLCEWTAPIMP